MLRIKFGFDWPSGSEEKMFEYYGTIHDEPLGSTFFFQNHQYSVPMPISCHGSHLGHVTLTIYINFYSPFLTMLHIKFGFDWPIVSEMMFKYYGYIHVYSPKAGADNTLGTKCFHKHKYSDHLPISCKFCPSNYIFTIFPIQMHGRPMLTLP